MMKKKVKEILNKLQPSHIAWLLAGVLLAEGFNWLLYKDIKRVTAPGLSSLVAVCALVLAIYSAFQVKKWMDNKVNETAFKKSEGFIDNLIQMNNNIVYLTVYIQILKMTNSNDAFEKVLDKISYHVENILIKTSETYAFSSTFKVWGIDYINIKSFDEINKKLGHQLGYLYSLTISNELTLETLNEKDIGLDKIENELRAINSKLNELLEEPYKSSFVYSSHHPQKR
ncbi:TPA: hypothetical protein QHY55_005373 [Klebsiella pneumoniae subsp. pneumoniae]|jgi:hypothetical protein|uniref:hypothetical protein n=1 Tax=Klebsiella TaxID=570 RepID=UPI000A9CE00B|nr:hypothetical protein [Klebsiella michiganensis]ELT0602650.1 hypothetical protein [Raoultella ornithinolytica]HBR6446601.1 hypothetical protein [Klebsiella pneumoniae]HCA5513697.1 hypothetical protein [Klebsiella variicola]HDS5087181.1 hypothetical protein [Klebsiella pneumoniae subsp. pneumoniae]ELT0734762.1 hypothetical protein [Raoultella ornithinolytica]